MKQPALFSSLSLFFAAATITAGCVLTGGGASHPVSEPVYSGDTKEMQDRRIQTNINIAREMDGEKPDLACQCLLQAEEDINYYKREPLDFGITREGMARIRRDNHCAPQ